MIDRLTSASRSRGRLAEAIDSALKMGDGALLVVVGGLDRPDETADVKPKEILFSSDFACGKCGESFRQPTPQLFSFNSPQGMCPGCDGLGKLYTFVPELLVPDPKLSFRKGAIALIGKWSALGKYKRHIYSSVAESIEQHYKLDAGTMLNTPWCDLPEKLQEAWLWGTGNLHITYVWRGGGRPHKYGGEFDGIVAELIDRYRNARNKMYLRAMEKYMDTLHCPDCDGDRLNPQARSVRIPTNHPDFHAKQAYSLPELCGLPANRLADFFESVELEPAAEYIASEILKEIRTRIGFLLGVGLDYLSLSRTAPTLSGGESQRIRLAGQIGSGLSGVLYILDEPSIGLHARDNDRLIDTLLSLRDRGNTLIVVEHDEDTMRAADMLVDFGPGPGVKGGRIVASGDLKTIAAAKKSVTGDYLAGRERIDVPAKVRSGNGDTLIVRNASHNNLKNIDVSIPLGTLTCVTGVSGSGKSSLIGDILEPALRNQLNGAEAEPGPHDGIEGIENLDKTIAIDQTPIGRTPRSNPGTYVKVFDEIRKLYAQLPDAKTRGFTASRFSFNVDGGRCSACDGNGATKLEMDFLADIWVSCVVCGGHRYNRETLAVKFKGHSIADVLEMDISQALQLFKNIPKIATRLQTLVDVGLEYLKLGQPSPTLSGGEAQRIKLSRELSKKATGKTFYVLDEPTTGLHFADIKLLLKVLHHLVDLGNTVVVVEHNLDVIKTADWVIDLGPEGGEHGGEIVCEGTPRDIAADSQSHTGKALANVLGSKSKKSPSRKKKSAARRSRLENAQSLIVEGAAQHNLKSVNVELPRDAMTVFCGPSGSGKSSLAMDTIYAEGQRRYVESLSSYARQFIGQMQKPQAERIQGLSPAVALEQKNLGHSPRSTVGTVTEIYDYFRILMARLGVMFCPECHCQVGTQTVDQIVDKVLQLPEGTKCLLLAPLHRPAHQDPEELWTHLREDGFHRIRVDGVTHRLDSPPELDVRRQQELQLVIDRLTIRNDDRTRISESIELGAGIGKGVIQLAIVSTDRDEPQWEMVTHSQHLACEQCGRSFPTLTPHHFSFNTSAGWCPDCEGLGVQTGTNPAALLRGEQLSMREGAVALWPNLQSKISRAMLVAFCRHTSIDPELAICELSARERRQLYHGTHDSWIQVRPEDWNRAGQLFPQPPADPDTPPRTLKFQFKGLYPAVDEASRLSPAARYRLQKFTAEIDCTACDATRLTDVASAVQFEGKTIGDFVRMPLEKLASLTKAWKLDARQRRIAGELLREIKSRVNFLVDVGLGYLTLGRAAATLSGGEAQRIRLAAQLGSGLCGVLYVLDEPTIGLHPRDNRRLLSALHKLRDLGNTLLVVEHDYDVIAGSDFICDFGPRAGRLGGQVVAKGPPNEIKPEDESVTGPYLDGRRAIPIPENRRPVDCKASNQTLRVLGASEHNLRGIDVTIPLGVFTAVTGPSGSGKSTLINDIVHPALARQLHRSMSRPGRHGSIVGIENIDKVIRVDQSPLGNTPSSTPATYCGVFDLIRMLFAKLPEAKARGYTARQFSFNVPGGRCDGCEGSGQNCIEMHFLPDVWVKCEDCDGHRFNRDTLEVRYHGKSISDVLEMSCGEALQLFDAQPKIARILQTLVDVGLDYITLGQSAPTLSGGEAQRVKLAAELSRPQTGKTLYLLDEPTTGLHFDDIRRLLDVLQRLVDLGNSVVVIEHNLDVIKTVDWVIDLGPEAGNEGGNIVTAGTPEDVAAFAERARKSQRRSRKNSTNNSLRSYTGEFLAEVLQRGPYETRATLDADGYLKEQLAAQRAALHVESKTEAAWEKDGRAWHLENPTDRRGEPVKWEPQCISLLIERIESDGRFGDVDFNHPSTVEVRGSKAESTNQQGTKKKKAASRFHSKHWFLHAFSSESKWMKAKFRVPSGTFVKKDLMKVLKLPTLNQMNLQGVYSNDARVRMMIRKEYQEIEIRFFLAEELDTPEFLEFFDKAIHAYLPDAKDANSPKSKAKKKSRPTSKQELVIESSDNSSSSGGTAAQRAQSPWQALGRRWHSLPKGFPENAPPDWPLPLADSLVESLEAMIGSEALQYTREDAFEIQVGSEEKPVGRVETKHPDALRLVLEAGGNAIDSDLIERIQFAESPPESDESTKASVCAIFKISEAKHLRSRNFRKFLKQFFSTLDG